MNLDLYKIGKNIRNLREKSKLTNWELCDALDIGSTHLYLIEEGHRCISMKLLLKLMEVLDADANSILGVDMDKYIHHRGLPKMTILQNKMEALTLDERNYLMSIFEQMINRALEQC